ncbi:phosphate transport system substrate-binding protein [Franzmannia pantelleriensis]|uniref:Phosphate transport system substrate-binding protein n=1 Tax=Franzmannia pantelleriensis TaxID=48727 RepID=A0A1G9L3D4_9GAMM|nr:substrate-binding domain-containing protein [Halomonas pantelleriensis]SDL56441.1 phosphate transport system substrate-binding protein [Halomonas pantelleriensis]
MQRLLLLCCLLMAWPLSADEGIVVGSLDSVGSETLAGLMLRWGERLERQHPGVRLQLQASGSATAPAALAAGTSRLGPMSRRMSAAEREEIVARQGHPPLEIPLALDALAVFVHRHHQLEALSLADLDAIFSDTRRCGAPETVNRWEMLPGSSQRGSVARHGRNSVSGTHGVFKRQALCGGDFRLDVSEHTGSAAVVAAVAASPGAIGYAGAGYLTAGVRAVALENAGGEALTPTADNVLNGDYPLSRALYLYVNLPPGERLPPSEAAFFELVLSDAGQSLAEESGFIALPESQRREARALLGLEEG